MGPELEAFGKQGPEHLLGLCSGQGAVAFGLGFEVVVIRCPTAPLAASWSRRIARLIASRRAVRGFSKTAGSFIHRKPVGTLIPVARAASSTVG